MSLSKSTKQYKTKKKKNAPPKSVKMKHFSAIIAFILLVSDVCWAKECVNRKTTSKLVCYYSKLTQIDNHCECTHVILPPNAELKEIEAFKENYDRNVKILITVNEFNQVGIQTDLAPINQTN